MAKDQKDPKPADVAATKVPQAPAVQDSELSDEELGKVSGGVVNVRAAGMPDLRNKLP